MVTSGRRELTVSHFYVDVQGLVVAAFHDCSGLNGEIEVETYQEGGLNSFEHKLPGRTKFGNVTLKMGMTTSMELWDWFESISRGDFQPKNISIVACYHDGREAARWNLVSAYPVRWEGPSLSATDASIAVHTLELAHHGITASVT